MSQIFRWNQMFCKCKTNKDRSGPPSTLRTGMNMGTIRTIVSYDKFGKLFTKYLRNIRAREKCLQKGKNNTGLEKRIDKRSNCQHIFNPYSALWQSVVIHKFKI